MASVPTNPLNEAISAPPEESLLDSLRRTLSEYVGERRAASQDREAARSAGIGTVPTTGELSTVAAAPLAVPLVGAAPLASLLMLALSGAGQKLGGIGGRALAEKVSPGSGDLGEDIGSFLGSFAGAKPGGIATQALSDQIAGVPAAVMKGLTRSVLARTAPAAAAPLEEATVAPLAAAITRSAPEGAEPLTDTPFKTKLAPPKAVPKEAEVVTPHGAAAEHMGEAAGEAADEVAEDAVAPATEGPIDASRRSFLRAVPSIAAAAKGLLSPAAEAVPEAAATKATSEAGTAGGLSLAQRIVKGVTTKEDEQLLSALGSVSGNYEDLGIGINVIPGYDELKTPAEKLRVAEHLWGGTGILKDDPTLAGPFLESFAGVLPTKDVMEIIPTLVKEGGPRAIESIKSSLPWIYSTVDQFSESPKPSLSAFKELLPPELRTGWKLSEPLQAASSEQIRAALPRGTAGSIPPKEAAVPPPAGASTVPSADEVVLFRSGDSDFFTTNAERAASYPGDMTTVTVPKAIFETGRSEAAKLGQPTPQDTVLPNEWVKKAVPFEKPDVTHVAEDTGQTAEEILAELEGKMKAAAPTAKPGLEIPGPETIQATLAADTPEKRVALYDDMIAQTEKQLAAFPEGSPSRPHLAELLQKMKDARSVEAAAAERPGPEVPGTEGPKGESRLVPRRPDGSIGPYENMTPSEQLDHVIYGNKPAFYDDGSPDDIAKLVAQAKKASLPFKVIPNPEYTQIFVGKDSAKLKALLKAESDTEATGRALGYTKADIKVYNNPPIPEEEEVGTEGPKGGSVPLADEDNSFTYHSTDSAAKLEGILSGGLKEGHASNVKGQGTSGPYVIVYEGKQPGLKPVAHRPGDQMGTVSGTPKAVIVHPEEFVEEKPLAQLEAETRTLDAQIEGLYAKQEAGTLSAQEVRALKLAERKVSDVSDQYFAALDAQEKPGGYVPKTHDAYFEEAKAIGAKYGVPVIRAGSDEEGELTVPKGSLSAASAEPSVPPEARSAAFKKWFGESKVVDATGEPQVVYHATNAEEPFTSFNPGDFGSHFGTKGQANAISSIKDRTGIRVYPVFLSIENPLRLPDLGGGWESYTRLGAALKKTGKIPAKAVDEVLNFSVEGESPVQAAQEKIQALRGLIEDKGYDGIVYVNTAEDPKAAADSYIAFHPNQIKSATGNVGTFSPASPDIRYGLVPAAAAAGTAKKKD